MTEDDRLIGASFLAVAVGFVGLLFAYLIQTWRLDDMVEFRAEERTILTDSIARLESALDFQTIHAEGLEGEQIECWVKWPIK